MTRPAWQTKYRAQKRARQTYRVPLFCAPVDPRTPCVIHGALKEGQNTELHHLGERGKEHEEQWFFENLIPICPADNKAIEESRKAKSPLSTAEDLSPAILLARSWTFYSRGEPLRAYACARLGSFIAWSPGRPGWTIKEGDPNPSLDLAAQCLLCLRIVDPQYAVPLAIDTLDRSVLQRLNEPLSNAHAVGNSTLFTLAVALGAFHRDYRDYATASDFFNIADQYSTRLFRPGSTESDYIRFLNHRLINSVGLLEEGSSDLLSRKGIRDFVSLAEYGQYLARKMNIVYWSLRELRTHADPAEITDNVKDVPLAYLKAYRNLRAIEWTDHIPRFTPVLEAEYLLIAADAWSQQGRHDDAKELLRLAAKIYEKGHFGASQLLNSHVIESMSKNSPKDFHFPFKYSSALHEPHYRTRQIGAASFCSMSHKLLEKLLLYSPIQDTSSRVTLP